MITKTSSLFINSEIFANKKNSEHFLMLQIKIQLNNYLCLNNLKVLQEMLGHVYEKRFSNQCALSYLGHSNTAPVCLLIFCLFSVAPLLLLREEVRALSPSLSFCLSCI